MQLMMKLMMINHGVRTGQEEEMVMQQLGKEVVKVGKDMEEEKVGKEVVKVVAQLG